jgi:hypothetical protein
MGVPMATRCFPAFVAVTSLVSLVSLASFERESAACGGCFHPPTENPTVVTDHRMIFAVSQTATTLYDQMRYDGAPSSFAWVLRGCSPSPARSRSG